MSSQTILDQQIVINERMSQLMKGFIDCAKETTTQKGQLLVGILLGKATKAWFGALKELDQINEEKRN